MKLFLTRQLHISWHIAWVCSGLLVGVALAIIVPPNIFANTIWLILALTLMAVIFINRRVFMVFLALISGILLGLWRGSIEQSQLQNYEIYYNQHVFVQGKIAEDTAVGPSGDQRIKLNEVRIGQQKLSGQVWVSTSSGADIKRGDIAVFEGQLSPGFGNLPAAMYRAKLTSAERPRPGDIAREIRDWFAANIRLAIAEPQASLGVGYLVGQRSALPQELNDQLKILGLTHIVVASGYNLTILVRLARQLFARISKYLATLAAGGMIASFVLVTGLSPSMSRAGLIAGLSLAAWYYGRVIHPMILLPFAAAITVLINPAFIWGDIGWYLSFAAFVGVIMLAPLVTSFFWNKQKKPGIIGRILIETASAQILTMPIIAFIFGQYAPLALPANLLILPLIPLTMLLTFIAGIGGIFLSQIANLIGFPAQLVLNYMTSIVDWLAALPWAQGEIEFGLLALITSYVAILILMIWLRRKTGHGFGRDSVVD